METSLLVHLNYGRFTSLQHVPIYKLPSCANLIWFDNVQGHWILDFEHFHNNSFHFLLRRDSFQSVNGGSPWRSKVSLQRISLQGLLHICHNCPTSVYSFTFAIKTLNHESMWMFIPLHWLFLNHMMHG